MRRRGIVGGYSLVFTLLVVSGNVVGSSMNKSAAGDAGHKTISIIASGESSDSLVGAGDDDSSNLDDEWELAIAYVQTSFPDMSIDDLTKLTFYANYKQATKGPCSQVGGEPPWYIDYTTRMKWDAWSSLGDKDPELAKRDYIALLNAVAPNWRNEMLI